MDSTSFNQENHSSHFHPVMPRQPALCCRLCGFYSRSCAIGIIAVDLGLVALNLHFLSDVIAGSFVGVSTGLFTVALWGASEPAMFRSPWPAALTDADVC
jgi:membrane-associated phospholipid phosphatase